MADTVTFFLGPEDEVALFRQLEPLHLTLYTEIVDPNEPTQALTGAAASQLTLSSYYIAAEEVGAVELYPIKRGPNRGKFGIDEIRSPVIHYERSLREGGALLSGRIWAELVVSQSTEANVGKSEQFRRVFDRMRDLLKRNLRSKPIGAFVGPHAVRLYKSGVRLLGAGRKGKTYEPFR